MNGYDVDLLELDEDLSLDDDFEYDDEMMAEDDDLEAILESVEEDDDDASERRRRRRRRRRPTRVRAGRVGRGRFRVRRPKSAVGATQSQLRQLSKSVAANGQAIKRVTVQINKANKTLSAANARQDSDIASLRRTVKKQQDAFNSSQQLSLLLPLLQKSPELEAKPNLSATDQANASTVLNSVQLKKQDNTLPLLLMMMGTQMGGGSSGNQMNMMLPLILLMDK